LRRVIACARCLRLVGSKSRSAPLHGDAGRIADLDPDAARAGLIGAIDLFRHDTLGAKPVSVCEDDRAVLGDVFIEQDAGLGIAQQPRQRALAVEAGADAPG
jgi:hypothetical protein